MRQFAKFAKAADEYFFSTGGEERLKRNAEAVSEIDFLKTTEFFRRRAKKLAELSMRGELMGKHPAFAFGDLRSQFLKNIHDAYQTIYKI